MASEEQAPNIRIYTFQRAGFIPGIPGIIPGGQQVKVNEDTLQIVATAPIGQPFPEDQTAQNEPVVQAEPASQAEVAPGTSEQEQVSDYAQQTANLPDTGINLASALGTLGGTN